MFTSIAPVIEVSTLGVYDPVIFYSTFLYAAIN